MNKRSAKTVLFFDHTAKMGGGEISLFHLVQRFNQERYFPVVVLGAEGELNRKLKECGIETHVLPLSENVANTRKDSLGRSSLLQFGAALRIIRYAFRLARFIRKRKIDFIHTNSLKADIIGGIAARLARVPVIWHVRDRIEDDYLPRSATRAFRYLCRTVPNFIIVNSEATLKTLRLPNPNGVGASRIKSFILRSSVVYNGVVHDGVPADSIEEFGGKCGTEAAPRPSEQQRVGLVGRISPWKGQHVFIRAASEVRQVFPECHFLIIGSAMFGEEDYEREIKELASSLNLDDCLEFTGFRTDVPELVQSLDVLVHASTTGEPFGQVIAEGMAACKPVVATMGGAVPEIVQDGVTGLLVPMGDAHSMAEAIIKLLSDPELAQQMGAAGRQRVEEHFTMEHVVQRVEAIYDRFWERQMNARATGPRS
jgi:glycosyltransferase involved in cell wall biosynthesis